VDYPLSLNTSFAVTLIPFYFIWVLRRPHLRHFRPAALLFGFAGLSITILGYFVNRWALGDDTAHEGVLIWSIAVLVLLITGITAGLVMGILRRKAMRDPKMIPWAERRRLGFEILPALLLILVLIILDEYHGIMTKGLLNREMILRSAITLIFSIVAGIEFFKLLKPK